MVARDAEAAAVFDGAGAAPAWSAAAGGLLCAMDVLPGG